MDETRRPAADLFEREAGDVAWRHASEEPESRHKRDLVVRSAAVLGNYDYVFDWTFQQDGTIRVSVGATGIAQVHDGPAQRRKPREFDRFLHPVTPQRV